MDVNELSPEMQEQLKATLDFFAPEPLDPELVPYLTTGGMGQQALFHPLIHDPFYTEHTNKHRNAMFRQKKLGLAEAIEKGKWGSFLFLHERPYRIDALEAILHEHEIRDPQTIWPLVSSVWTDSENIADCIDQWRDIWDQPIPCRQELVMGEEEREAFAAMPDVIDIYRGFCHEGAEEGMSWTIERGRAEWFAHRWSGVQGRKPFLASGKVQKADVLAYLMGRGESEIVVLPENVMGVEIETLKAKRRKA